MAFRARENVRRTSLLILLLGISLSAFASESRFSETRSRSQYVHWIDLYDAADHRIDPTSPDALPYSPHFTCGRCHDYETIARGYHFNAKDEQAAPGRPGEPWVWTDTQTGTQLPLSYRGWPGTYDPQSLGITSWQFVRQFGRHLPGGIAGESAPKATSPKATPGSEAAAKAAPAGAKQPEAPKKTAGSSERWSLAGSLDIDCMTCHSHNLAYNFEAWAKQISDQNFAWAPSVAMGLASVVETVSSLPENFDPAAADAKSGKQLPRTAYAANRIDAENKVFFDVVRKPLDNACYYCHSTYLVGEGAGADWTHDADVHLQAGMSCSDCHRNGIEHHTVRGFEGEQSPTGESVATLSCRGCHLGEAPAGGRLGAPKPLHKGLPPLHLDRLSCTSCHSGPAAGKQAMRIQTAMAHGLGLPSHAYTVDTPPGVVAGVLMQDSGVLYPHRMLWPSFWGALDKTGKITPLNPEDVNDALRRTLRVRRGSSFTEAVSDVKLTVEDKVQTLGQERGKLTESQLADEEKAKLKSLVTAKAPETFRTKLAEALPKLKEKIAIEGAEPVFVSGGRAYRLIAGGAVEEFSHDVAKPYAWKLAHDVRPARSSTGIRGCFDCHAAGSPIFEGQVTALGPAPDKPITQAMYELAGFDKQKLDAWNLSFQGRTAFKWFGFAAIGAVGLILLSYLLLGVHGVVGMIRRP